MPWFSTAHLDEAYQPIVSGDDFRHLAVSGGRKTLVNIAVHLTLLAFVRDDPNTVLPAFLVIDSPREGIGSAGSDKAMSARTSTSRRCEPSNAYLPPSVAPGSRWSWRTTTPRPAAAKA